MTLGPTQRPVRVLFLNTHVAPSLGADVWVHARIMEGLSRETHELSTACVPRPGTPCPGVARSNCSTAAATID